MELSAEARSKVEQATTKILWDGVPAGRGFVVGGGIILTAAHCLPEVNNTGGVVLGDYHVIELEIGGKLTKGQMCYCELFNDIAAIGPPDSQGLYEIHNAYVDAIESIEPLEIDGNERELFTNEPAFVWSHEGDWLTGTTGQFRAKAPAFWHSFPDGIKGGTSGSPIVSIEGHVVGLVSNMSEPDGVGDPTGHSPRPSVVLPPYVFNLMAEEI